MDRFLRRTGLTIILLGLLCLCPASAQEDAAQALSHSAVLEQSFINQDSVTFDYLVTSNPEMSRKAFLIRFLGLTQMTNETQQLEVLMYLQYLAQRIQYLLGDTGPATILNALQSQNSQYLEQAAAQYLLQLYPQMADGTGTGTTTATEMPEESPPTPYDRNKLTVADLGMSPQEWRAVRPFYVKLMRTVLAMGYYDPNLLIQELDTFSNYLGEAAQRHKSAGREVPRLLTQIEALLQVVRTQTTIELGWASNITEESLKLPEDYASPGNQLLLNLVAFRSYIQQQQPEKAQTFLRKSKAVLATNDPEISPVTRFAVRTAEVELALTRGDKLSQQEILRRFDGAWGELKDYTPLQYTEHDSAWYLGRESTKFWISQLGTMGDQGLEKLLTMYLTVYQYWETITTTKFAQYTGDDMLLHFGEVESFVILYLSLIDVPLQIVEQEPRILETSGVSLEQISAYENLVRSTVQMASDSLNLTESGPHFPPFDITKSSYIDELVTRSRYVSAVDPRRPDDQKTTLLTNLMPRLQNLVRPETYIDYHLKVGRRLRDLGQDNLAVSAFERALKKAEDLGYTGSATEASTLLAEQYGKAKNWQKASQYADKAATNLGTELFTPGGLSDAKMKEKSDEVVAVSVEAHIKSNNPEKALEVLSQSQQAQSASIQLSSNKEATKASQELNEKNTQLTMLSRKVSRLKTMPESATRDKLLEQAEKLLADGKAAFLTAGRKLREKFEVEYKLSLRYDPLHLPSIQKLLPQDVAVLQYFATDNEFYIFVVTHDDLKLRQVTIKREELDNLVLDYLTAIRRLKDTTALSKRLYGVLFEPAAKDIASSKTLILLPSGELNSLPFASLTDATGAPIINSKSLVALGQTDDFRKIAETEPLPINKVAVFANATKDLPSAEREGESVAELFPGSQVFTREKASKKNLTDFPQFGNALHLATHGTQHPKNSTENYLSLSDGHLEQGEIFRLPLENTALVTLSACSTALREKGNKKFIYATTLAEAFWLGGSRSVVASLWQVDDESTRLLMVEFYKQLKAGESKATALRLAQESLRNNPNFSHPFFWSGFVLFGDYR